MVHPFIRRVKLAAETEMRRQIHFR